MQKKEFKISIDSPCNVVWHVLWNDKTYKQWTSVFHEGSHAVSDWQEGSEIKFLGPNGDGMYSVIAKKEEPSRMEFKHLGELKAGEKQKESDWSGSMEIYTLKEKEKNTDLNVEIDIVEEFGRFFEKVFPQALQKIKELAEAEEAKIITIEADVNAPVEKVWKLWTTPEHIKKWNNASPDWHTPRAENNLRAGGTFSIRMEAKDGNFGFDFDGVYDVVKPNEYIEYTLGDGRKVKITFAADGSKTNVTESFEAETINSLSLQQGGWQSILNNFKSYAEAN